MSESEAICCQEPEVDFVVLDRIIHDEFDGKREKMIMMMQAVQRRYRYLPEAALYYLAQVLGAPITKIYEVATFYASFSLAPKGRHRLHVCTGTACHLRGSGGMVRLVAAKLGVEPGGTTPDMKFTLETVNGLVLLYAERKVAGFIQRRPGPYEVGPHGLLQPFADAGKLISKQLVAPMRADRLLFWLAPLVSLAPVVVCFLPIPFSPLLTGMDVNLGLLLILAFSGLNTLALCLAGWGSNNKYSLLGAARAVAQSVAYEIPLLLSVLAVSFQVGSLDLSAIAATQTTGLLSWNAFVQPLAFLIFFISAVAETNRAPFDLPEAESELTAGFHTEYSGMGFGIFFLAEYSYMVVVCAVAAALIVKWVR